ncbi:MAG: hypothetical protein HY525_00585 [Betaproteobacteria bacterium]|nr:hypothetical protein [Betaproteobacteria bacterium]
MFFKSSSRECQPCTACCDGWVQIAVNGYRAYPGHPCPQSTGAGCDDYEHRPFDPCVKFICGWRADGSPLPEWMKPNNSKVIVLFNESVWNGMPVDVGIPVGKRIPPRALNWLQQFAESHGRALLHSEQIVENGVYTNRQAVCAFGPPEFQQEMAERASRGESFV